MIRRFAFRQLLVGSYRSIDDPLNEHPLCVSLAATRSRLLPPLSGRLAVSGEIDAKGLADHQPLSGSVASRGFAALLTEYELTFVANDGRPLRLTARRQASLREPLGALSRVTGSILDAAGERLGELELRLDYRDSLRQILR